jgi:ribosomal protein S27E
MKDKKYKLEFDYVVDEPDTFEIHIRCGNCWNEYGVRVKKGVKINKSHFQHMKCKRCGIVGMIFQVGWDGHVYVKLENLR